MSTSSTRIPQEELESARLRLKRRVASVLISAMAEAGISFDELDARIGKEHGFSKGFINQLIDGTTKELDIVSDLSFGMGYEAWFNAKPIPLPSEPDQEDA